MADGKRHSASPQSEVSETATPMGETSKSTAEKSRYADLGLSKRDHSNEAKFPVGPNPHQ